MRVLAIETSCDETAISILDCAGDTSGATFTILSDALFSQAHLHAEYGGVYPSLAKREHNKNLPLLLTEALVSAAEKVLGSPVSPKTARGPDFSPADTAALLHIDLIAVTQGPGLEPALWEGIEFAKTLSEEWGVPVVGTDHMEGHIVSGLVTQTSDTEYALMHTHFPILGLLISGGHTELVLMKEWFKYELVGKTKDDAVGEAFDKVARMIGLDYPGGPKIEAYAAASKLRGDAHGIVFPRPLAHDSTCDFSFSGLKTAVLYKLKTMPMLSEQDKEHVAEAFQDAARDVLVLKTVRALEQTGAKTLAVGGGVSASKAIRSALQGVIEGDFPDVRVAYPDGKLHLDNAIMIGMAAYLRHTAGLAGRPLSATGSQSLA